MPCPKTDDLKKLISFLISFFLSVSRLAWTPVEGLDDSELVSRGLAPPQLARAEGLEAELEPALARRQG